MLETLAYALPALVVLFALDAAVRGSASGAAARLVQAARLVALFLLAAAIAGRCRVAGDLAASVGWMALFGLGGFLALELAQRVGLLAMRGLGDAVGQGNLAAATTAAAHTAAIGVLVANVSGGTSWGEFGLAAVAFAIGQASLLLLVWLFRCLTSYDDGAAILAGNQAAALSHGGLTLALALLIAWATDGEYAGPWPALRDYGLALAEGLVVWPLRQLVVQCLILRERPRVVGGALDRAIGEHGDVGAGALEGATYLAAALFVRSLG